MSTPEKETIPAYDKHPILHLYLMRLQTFGTIGDKDDLSAFLLELDRVCGLSSQPSPGLRWVRASERLPRFPFIGEMLGLREVGNPLTFTCTNFSFDHEKNTIWFNKVEHNPEEIEWLEETPSVQPIEGEQKANSYPPTPDENPEGFHKRYIVFKTSGEPVDENAEYLVLRVDWGGDDKEHIRAGRTAARAYANAVRHHLPKVAEDILLRYTEEGSDNQGLIHVKLPVGAIARVAPDASPELLDALNTMVEKAMQMPIADKEVPKDGEPPKELKDYLEAKMRPYHNRISFIAGALECYHKMQEEINDAHDCTDHMHDICKHYQTELSTQAIQIADLKTKLEVIQKSHASILASNKECEGQYKKYVLDLLKAHKQIAVYRKGLEEIVRTHGHYTPGPLGNHLYNIATEYLAKYSSPTRTDKQ